MKKTALKIIALSTIVVFGGSLFLKANAVATGLVAEQHIENYQAYTYTGTYYSKLTAYSGESEEGLNGAFRKRVTSLIHPTKWYTYSGSSDGTLGKILQDSDEDPTNKDNMVLFYTRESISKRASGGSISDWNREHVWPQSLSNDHWGKSEAGADLLHIRPTWYTTNNRRGSIVYGDNNKKNAQTYNGMVYAYTSGGVFEPIDAVKGDVARILMYVYTAYIEHYNDSSLVVTKAIESYDTLLKWHTMDAPDALEGHRNDYCQSSRQANRNPFVDHPEMAWQIFGNSASASVKQECKNKYPGSNVGPSSSSSSSLPPSSESSSSSLPVSSSSSSSSSQSTSESSVVSSSSESSSISSATTSSSEVIISSSTSEEPISTSNNTDTQSFFPTDPSESTLPPSNSSGEGNNKKSAGCSGSIIGVASITVTLGALVGSILIFSKKEE